ncbi:15131_t:CDS:2, partial [Rhizophagus irregularis]
TILHENMRLREKNYDKGDVMMIDYRTENRLSLIVLTVDHIIIMESRHGQ